MYSKMLTKFLFGFFTLYFIAAYGSVAMTYKSLPLIIASQWYTLASVIVVLTAFVAICTTLFNFGMIFEIDNDCKKAKLKIYTMLHDNVISPVWHWLLAISMIGLFQIGNYGDSIVTLCLFSCIITFRIAHQSVVRKAKIQVLNSSITKK